jgi:hypothetical protein
MRLDVPALIRSFVDLSQRLWGGQHTPVIEVDPLTLRFRDRQLELVYASYCLCTENVDTSTSRWLLSELSYVVLLFVATFITPTPARGRTDSFYLLHIDNSRPNYTYLSYGCIIIADLLYWVTRHFMRPWRERVLAATAAGDWLPLTRYMLSTSAIVPLTMTIFALISALSELELSPFGERCVVGSTTRSAVGPPVLYEFMSRTS